LVGFFGALRRSEIVALNYQDVQFGEEGMTLIIRKSKTDQLRHGRLVRLTREPGTLDPQAALRDWLRLGGLTEGPIFRRILATHRLSGRAVARIVKKRVATIGRAPHQFSGHSLRAGFATSAAMAGLDALLIARQTGHKSQQMVATYVRPAANVFAQLPPKAGMAHR
jgi:integrase